ncbi:MAG: LapA family protein [Marinibacterium sp.]|nr:LapA family protein [Marinibacterium sp.]
MRYIKLFIVVVLIVLLVSFTMANLQVVTVQLMTDRLAGLIGFNWSISLPLFMIMLIGVAIGLALGYIFEWLREHKHRRQASVSAREARKLEREVAKLKQEKHKDKDEILALLEEAR